MIQGGISKHELCTFSTVKSQQHPLILFSPYSLMCVFLVNLKRPASSSRGFNMVVEMYVYPPITCSGISSLVNKGQTNMTFAPANRRKEQRRMYSSDRDNKNNILSVRKHPCNTAICRYLLYDKYRYQQKYEQTIHTLQILSKNMQYFEG